MFVIVVSTRCSWRLSTEYWSTEELNVEQSWPPYKARPRDRVDCHCVFKCFPRQCTHRETCKGTVIHELLSAINPVRLNARELIPEPQSYVLMTVVGHRSPSKSAWRTRFKAWSAHSQTGNEPEPSPCTQARKYTHLPDRRLTVSIGAFAFERTSNGLMADCSKRRGPVYSWWTPIKNLNKWKNHLASQRRNEFHTYTSAWIQM